MNEKLTELAIAIIDFAINYVESMSSFFDDPRKAVDFFGLILFFVVLPFAIVFVVGVFLLITKDKTEKRRDE